MIAQLRTILLAGFTASLAVSNATGEEPVGVVVEKVKGSQPTRIRLENRFPETDLRSGSWWSMQPAVDSGKPGEQVIGGGKCFRHVSRPLGQVLVAQCLDAPFRTSTNW
ncbi:MAG: hypothetical protein Ct9H300mP1_13720 [Planctomycetaceae bacterium]|nr:MAG: hypothetical protein Ct9H300mP1_13720 [Planctomycetaceae bacterium]